MSLHARLQAKYATVAKVRVPHKDVGCWWTLYDYGYATVRKWPANYKHPYPGAVRRIAGCRTAQQLTARALRRVMLEQTRLFPHGTELWLWPQRATRLNDFMGYSRV